MRFGAAFWLSLLLAFTGCTGMVLAGRGKWQGWALGLAAQPVWAAFAIVSKGYGLLLTSLMYGTVYSRNLLRWRRVSPEGAPGADEAGDGRCERTLGEKPWWMSEGQYDASGGPCRCLLPAGHDEPCECEHATAPTAEGAPGEGSWTSDG